MALWTVGDVTRRIQALLDDPAGRRFKAPYLAPYIDQENDELLIFFESLGIQMQEQVAVWNLPAATQGPFDFTPYFAAGQPLQYCMRPKLLEWKLVGQPDVGYLLAALVTALDDVVAGNLGIQQWKWSGGSIQSTPSYTPVTVRLTFDAMSPTVFDPAGNVMRGIGAVLAARTAFYVAGLNNQMGKLQATLEKKVSKSERQFSRLMVLQDQEKLRFPQGTKRGVATQISAGGVPYI